MAVAAALPGPSRAMAQAAKVAVDRAPHYAGVGVRVQVQAQGFDREPQPVCQAEALPDGISLRDSGVRVSGDRRMTIDPRTGRVTRNSQYLHFFTFELVAARAGRVTIPSFTVIQDDVKASTRPFPLVFNDVEVTQDMRVGLRLPQEAVYPGQRVPVTIEWLYSPQLDVKSEYGSLVIQSPLFDRFRFIDEPVRQSGAVLPIMTAKGPVAVQAEVSKRVLNGVEYLVISATRRLVVDRPGTFELSPITAHMRRVTRWQRGVFGRREPAAVKPIRAVGKPRTLRVEPLPLDQAPAGFGGAVGRGFSIQIEADRSVVRVGDPIELTVTLRGDGNLAEAAMPPLAAATGGGGGLDPRRFRLPADAPAGTVSEDGRRKQFTATVRVTDESVTEIPPIPYAWFDPNAARFETVRSDPIALRVQATHRVGAEQVVSAADDAKATDTPPQSTAPVPVATASAKPFDLTGADLAIQTVPARLLADESQRFGGSATRAVVYGLSVLLVLVAWLRRRAADVDPDVARRRKLIRTQLRQISGAAGLPRQEAAGQIASALRHVASLASGPVRGQIDHLVGECDVVAFAPNGDASQRIDSGLHDRAVSVARSIAREVV